MSRFSKSMRAIKAIIQNPWLLNKVLEEDEVWRKYIERKFDIQQGFQVVTPEQLFGEFTETVFPFAYLEGGSDPMDLALLNSLARTIPDCRYFEIGTWRGESAANVARMARECVTLNLSDNEMSARNLGTDYIGQQGMFLGGLPNVRQMEGDSKYFNFNTLQGKFDLIFIDGDHRFDMVKNDTRNVFEFLVHEKTIVVWHDYVRNREKIRYEVMAGILEGCPEEKRKNIRYAAHTLCAVYFPAEYPVMNRSFLSRPEGYFTIGLNYKKGNFERA